MAVDNVVSQAARIVENVLLNQTMMALPADWESNDAHLRSSIDNPCFNSTVFESYINTVIRNATTLTRQQRREMEGDPLVYIVTVLIFYSCGIVILMINYMKKEQSESEEENLYKQYVEKARDRCNEYNLNHGRSLNRLALNALNAVNVISQDGDVSKIAYV